MAPDDISRETELAFTDGGWLGDALPLDDFAVPGLGPADAILEVGVLAAATVGCEGVSVDPEWLAATAPVEAVVELWQDVRMNPKSTERPLPTSQNCKSSCHSPP
jgi:hypothetical protein